MKNKLFIVLFAVVGFIAVQAQTVAGQYGEAELVETTADGMVTEIAFMTPEIVNVRHYRTENTLEKRDLVVTLQKQTVSVLVSSADENTTTLTSDALSVSYDKATGCVTFYDRGGQQLLTEKEGATALTARKDGPFDSYRVKQTFSLQSGERLYGLGQLQNGNWNQRGKSYDYMIEGNTSVWIPYLHSSKGYALYWDNPSPTTYKDNAAGMSLESAVGYGVDYYFLLGSTTDGQVATQRMRQLTGQVPMIPLWAYGFFQSKERYESADETMGVVRKYRQLNVPLDCVVQDWQYWGTNKWWNAMEFRNAKFRNYQQMIDSVHAMDAHLLISIWANFGTNTAPYQYFKENNMLMKQGENIMTDTYPSNEGVAIYDAYNPAARDKYWEFFYNGIASKGVDAYWMDSSEPDHYQGGTAMEETFDFVTGMGCTWRSVRNAFPLVHVGGVYEHHRSLTPAPSPIGEGSEGKRCMILTRSGYSGMQRYGANTWSGDVTASWQTLANQIPAALSYSICGNPNWNSDTGAFFNGDLKGPGNDEYNELYARWLQFSAFCPMMRSHGAGTDKAVYVWGKPGNKYYDNEVKYIHLRYSLLPYIYSTAWDVHENGHSFMNPMQVMFPEDSQTELLKDQFMFGQSLLVAPVLKYQAANRSIYLPTSKQGQGNGGKVSPPSEGSGEAPWYDFWTGESFAGGQTITKEVDVQTMPLYVHAGTILPFALPAQTAKVSDWDTLQIRVYPGADGSFTLYEDEGDSYRYEQGQYSTITFKWDDATHQLTIGQRQGAFTGMHQQRIFDVVVVSNGIGVGDSLSNTINVRISYDGAEQTVDILNSQLSILNYSSWLAPEDDGTEPFTFRAKEWLTGDPGRVAQGNITYDETANTITLKTSGAQNAALQLNKKLDGHYYYMNDHHLFCVRAIGISTNAADHQVWFMAGLHVGVVPATRTFTTPQGETIVVWETSDFIFKGNIVYLNLSGSFITCFGLTPANGETAVVSDINYYTEEEVADLEAGTLAIEDVFGYRSQGETLAVYDLQGRRIEKMSKGLYIKNSKKYVIR